MGKLFFAFTVSTLVALFFVGGGEGIWCFQCNSRSDDDCADIAVNDTMSTHYKKCEDTEKYQGAEPFCRKIEQKIHDLDGMIRVVRSCGWKKSSNPCYKVSNVGHSEIVCQCFTDACNSAPLTTTYLSQIIYLSMSIFIAHVIH